jgi:hypothetical protein
MFCQHCKTEKLKRGSKKYCSIKCKAAAKTNRIPFTCEHCRRPFEVPPCRTVQSNVRFCSHACHTNFYREAPTKRCPQCKQEVPRGEFRPSSGYCHSCCQKRERVRNATPERRWENGFRRAAKAGIPWDIGREQHAEFLKMPCHYCHRILNKSGTGLDQKVAGSGYTPDNVVPCCRRCNRVKGDDFSYDQMVRLAATIRELDRESPLAA